MRVRYRVIFSHGVLYETMTGLKRKLIMFYEKFVSSIADRVVCVSKYVQERRLADHIDEPGKQLVLGRGSCNGIDTVNKFNPREVSDQDIQRLRETYKICDNDFVIGFCGRLVRDKGVVELIDAFQQIIDDKKNMSIKLLIVGQFEKRDSLPMEIIEFITSNPNIIFTGPVPYEKIQQIYMLMNVLVLPTHREGFGMVAIEASAMERPVIVSNYTGCAETMIDGETGLYIDKSPESIKRAIEKCFDNDFSRKLGANGRNFVMTNFEHTKVRKYMLDFLNAYCKEVE
jgi:glycosyltransferase involved in cell wall biosynthesis